MWQSYAPWAWRTVDMHSPDDALIPSQLLIPHELDTKPESDAGKKPLTTEVCIYCISKGNDNMSKAFAPLLLKVFGLLPQNYTHLTLKSALTRDEREGRPEALHSVNPPQFTNWPKSHLFWFTTASTVSVWLSSIILLNALTIRVCPEREYTLVSQL